MDFKWKVTILLVINYRLLVSESSLPPPEIISTSSQIILAENNPLQLSCRGQKSINWTINRYKNVSNQDIRNCTVDHFGYVCKLTIPSVKVTDFGNYSCFYDEKDVPQLRSANVTVFVGGRPKVVLRSSLSENEVYEANKSYTLSCTAYGFPLPEITWKANLSIGESSATLININRTPTVNKELILIDNDRSPYLIQSNLTLIAASSITYLCNATNDYGFQVTSMDVTVSESVEALSLAIDKDKIEPGNTINIKCSANKKLYNNSILWKWKPFAQHIPLPLQRNKNTTDNETIYSFHSTLTIRDIAPSQAGVYICEVLNKKTNQPVSKGLPVVLEGSKLSPSEGLKGYSLNSAAKGTDSPHVHSFYGGDQISKGDQINLLCIGNQPVNWTKYPSQKNPQRHSKEKIQCSVKNSIHECILELKDAVFTDSGKYECSFIDGSQSDSLNLSVIGNPEFIHSEDFVDEKVCKLNDLCIISCSVEGNPFPKIDWVSSDCVDDSCSMNYQPLNELENVINTTTGQYSIQSTLTVRSNTSRRYLCKATNTYRDVQQEITVIASEESEKLVARPSYQLAHVNHSAVIKCTASKYYYLESQGITWTKDGEILLEEGDKYKIVSSTSALSLISELTIVLTQLEDSGNYFCTVVDNIKTLQVTQVASLRVIESIPPFITLTNVNGSLIKVDTGNPLRLLCSADGSPDPEMIWYWNKQPLNLTSMPWIQLNENKTELFISGAENEHSGVYECQAINSGGNTMVIYTVDVSLLSQKSDVGLIVGAVLIGAVAIVILIVAVLKKRNHSELPDYIRSYLGKLEDDVTTPLQKDSVYKPTTEEVER